MSRRCLATRSRWSPSCSWAAVALVVVAVTSATATSDMPVRHEEVGASPVASPARSAPEPLAARTDLRAGVPAPRLLAGTAGAPLTEASGEAAEDVARRFALDTLAPAGTLELVGTVVGGGGVRFVTLEQRFDGVPVVLGRITVAVRADGAVLAARVGELAPRGPVAGKAARPERIETPAAARAAALLALGADPATPVGDDFAAERVLVATPGGAEPAWRVRLAPGGRPDARAEVVVGAASALPLRVEDHVFPAVARARVVPTDPRSPSVLRDVPHPVLRPSVDSPAGWSFADDTTFGNNVRVQLDREADFLTTPGRVATATGTPPSLDFPYTGDLDADVDAALTNVWWALNEAHDRFRRLGFDESAGAMQQDGFRRGGRDDDPTWALVQYASYGGTTPYNQTIMGVGADGTFTWLVVGLYEDQDGILKDGAFETDLLFHEYAHGVQVRLVGDDPACLNGNQPQAISEGTSDYFAASFTNDPVIGAWTSGRADRGHRLYPVGQSPLTSANFCEGGCNRFNDGEIWSSFLWDLRAALVARRGAAGVEMADRLIVESLRYAPCRPTFTGGRDALLLADTALHGGAHRCDIWTAAVGRGLGASTTSGGPDADIIVGGFDMPPECGTGSSVALDAPEYGTDDDGFVEVVDRRAGAGATVRLSCSGGDSLTLPLAQVPGGPLLRAAFALEPGPTDPADGVLQCRSGETLTASYGTRDATARVAGTLDVRVLQHHVWGNWCQLMADDDYRNGWYNMPGFLDAGEVADVIVTFGNATDDELEDLVVRVSSSNPEVRVLPSGPLPVGTIGRVHGIGPRPFDVEVRADASPRVQPGDRATLTFDFTARGRSGTVDLELELSMDYVEELGHSPFDGGVETFDAGSRTARLWTSNAARGTDDQWLAEDCAGVAGTRGWRNGLGACAPYQDGQIATVLVSPPFLPLPADAIGLRFEDISWANDVDLWTDPANPYCDADILAAYATLDPALLPYDQPLNVYATNPLRVWLFPENTGGFVRQAPYGIDRAPQPIVPGYPYDQLRLAWVFWGDVIDCGFETPNAGTVRIDDVSVRYDVLRKVPETTPCASDCNLRAPLVMDPPGPKCPGEPFMLRAAGVEAQDCAGLVYYSFAGPGVPPASNWTTTPESPAVGEDGATYALYTQCETQPQCHDYMAIGSVSRALPGIGGPWPGSLRARREMDDVVLSWTGAAAPPAYGAWTARTRADLRAGIRAWTLAGRVDGEGPRGENAWRDAGGARTGAITYYSVLGRDACTDAARE